MTVEEMAEFEERRKKLEQKCEMCKTSVIIPFAFVPPASILPRAYCMLQQRIAIEQYGRLCEYQEKAKNMRKGLKAGIYYTCGRIAHGE